MTIAEIQQAIKELGFPLDKYKAPTASITTTVNRLVDADEVVIEKHVGGANEYKYVGIAGKAVLGRLGLLQKADEIMHGSVDQKTRLVDLVKAWEKDKK